MSHASVQTDPRKLAGLVLGAIGVVFGDIGTSPLYTLKECFAGHGLPLTEANVMGILSLIFWSMMIVVSAKYVMFIMRADNHGEGGILALMALAQRKLQRKRGQESAFLLLGVMGAALFYGDSMITPAMSVLSAIEGMEIALPKLHAMIIPLTIIVLVLLFSMQSKGTNKVGILFGPITVLWFLVLGILGVINLLKMPHVLLAVSPHHALSFLHADPWLAFLTLGAVVLALTGAEALYADMGHFGRQPIRLGWFTLVKPALLLNYFGQGALVLSQPATIKNPFFLMAPGWATLPLVLLATMATVIASQAVISGAYSVTRQAVQLGYWPRMDISHTSENEIGQIYIPSVNWSLLAAVIVLVIGFRNSGNMAAAYGIAVTGTMVITTFLAYAAIGRNQTGWRKIALLLLLALFLVIDTAFFAANAMKLADGGWFPILVAFGIFTLMLTWKRGRRILYKKLHEDELPRQSFVESIEAAAPHRVDGTAVFMTASSDTVPHALLHNLKHNKVLHETVVFLTVQTADVPYVEAQHRLQIKQLTPSFWQMVARYGFKEAPAIPELLEVAGKETGIDFDLMTTSFFLSRETVVEARHPAFSWWRRKLFSAMAKNATPPVNFFKIPPNRVVEMGMQVEM